MGVYKIRPHTKNTKMMKMAGVTEEKAWFRKGRLCSSLSKENRCNKRHVRQLKGPSFPVTGGGHSPYEGVRSPYGPLLIVLGRAIHGPMPVSGETFDELSAPLVHTNFPENKPKGPLVHTNFKGNSYGLMAP